MTSYLHNGTKIFFWKFGQLWHVRARIYFIRYPQSRLHDPLHFFFLTIVSYIIL